VDVRYPCQGVPKPHGGFGLYRPPLPKRARVKLTSFDVEQSCKSRLVSRSWKILAVALTANNGGLTTLEMAESRCRDDLPRNCGSGRYLSIASSVCWIADGGTRNRPE
jgi:hypothetical protein